MKRMLINATQPEELRVAIVDGQKLFNQDIEHPGREQKKANIYKGKITRIEPSLEAAFVDYGGERHGFLPLKDISRSYFREDVESPGRAGIKELLKEGQEVVVQIEKEERGTKGAALTTFISLAGRYLVLMPNNPRAGGVSRRIEGEDRGELREAMSQLEIPEGMGLIVRTAGIGKNAEELQWDLNYLLQLWEAIERSAASKPAPFLIYQDSNIIIRSMRDHLRSDIGEIIIDHPDYFEQASQFIQHVMPDYSRKLKLYTDELPLFSRYQIEGQIDSAYHRVVNLPSGGAIVIDQTEALTAIDINSARATKGADIEETALKTNLEAADEIARQLRLRDLGGLVIIDFIDMTPSRNQREVENRLKDALKHDRARVQLGRISRFGLLEMSRQRLQPSLDEATQLTCPRCSGQGRIRSISSLALSILRLIEEDAMKDNAARIIAQLPVDVATYLLNEKRTSISEIEQRHKTQVMLIPNPQLETPHYSIERQRPSDLSQQGAGVRSYELISEIEDKPGHQPQPKRAEQPLVRAIAPSAPMPTRAVAPSAGSEAAPVAPAPKSKSNFLRRLLGLIVGDDTTKPAAPQPETSPQAPPDKGRAQPARTGEAGQVGGRGSRDPRRRDQQDGREDGRSSGRGSNRRPAADTRSDIKPDTRPDVRKGGRTEPKEGVRQQGRAGARSDARAGQSGDQPTQPPVSEAAETGQVPVIEPGIETAPEQSSERSSPTIARPEREKSDGIQLVVEDEDNGHLSTSANPGQDGQRQDGQRKSSRRGRRGGRRLRSSRESDDASGQPHQDDDDYQAKDSDESGTEHEHSAAPVSVEGRDQTEQGSNQGGEPRPKASTRSRQPRVAKADVTREISPSPAASPDISTEAHTDKASDHPMGTRQSESGPLVSEVSVVQRSQRQAEASEAQRDRPIDSAADTQAGTPPKTEMEDRSAAGADTRPARTQAPIRRNVSADDWVPSGPLRVKKAEPPTTPESGT
jgi:ribonuclease E